MSEPNELFAKISCLRGSEKVYVRKSVRLMEVPVRYVC